MRRGEVWIVAGGPNYAGKPRPAVIVQDDRFDAGDSVTLVPFTTTVVDAPLFRMMIEATESTGLNAASHLMIDKLTTVPRARLGERLGRLSNEDVVRVNRSMIVFLGMAS